MTNKEIVARIIFGLGYLLCCFTVGFLLGSVLAGKLSALYLILAGINLVVAVLANRIMKKGLI